MSSSHLFDFLVNGGDDIKYAQAQAEHALGLLDVEIEVRKELLDLLREIRPHVTDPRAALKIDLALAQTIAEQDEIRARAGGQA